VDRVDKPLLEKMRDAGCYQMAFGVESGNETILKKMRKEITPDQIVKAFKAARDVGIETIAYFILGYPGETEESIKETIKLSKSIDPNYAQFSTATPYPGTELYNSLPPSLLENLDWNKLFYADLESKEPLKIQISNLTPEELAYWRERAYRKFYFRPLYVMKMLKKLKSFKELKKLVAGLRLLTK